MSENSTPLQRDGIIWQMPDSGNCSSHILKPVKALRLGLISNPLSGGNRKHLPVIQKLLAGHPEISHFRASTPSGVGSALSEFAQRGVDIVVVNGGDGTIHAVLTDLFRRSAKPLPLLALLRSGTASMIARDIGLHGPQRPALERLLTWVDTGRGNATIVQRPVLKVKRTLGRKPFYGMFFGAAGICQGIRFCLNRVHTKGLGGEIAAGVTLVRFLISAIRGKKNLLFPVPITIGLDKEPAQKQDTLLIIISTLERLFLGLRPYWGTEAAPIYYTALSARPKYLLRALPFLLRGRRNHLCIPKHGYFSRNIREAQLTFSGGFTLDGQLYAPDTGVESVTVSKGEPALFLRL